MNEISEKLRAYASENPSKWREEAEYRLANKTWLKYSQRIAIKMHDRMEELSMTQQMLADRMGCSQQYVSKILKGGENLSLETICKIEEALSMPLMKNAVGE